MLIHTGDLKLEDVPPPLFWTTPLQPNWDMVDLKFGMDSWVEDRRRITDSFSTFSFDFKKFR